MATVFGVALPALATSLSRLNPIRLLRISSTFLLLFVFLLGVKGLGDGFKLLGNDLIQGFFTATEDPFVGLIIGLLATTLVQSSSVTTSMIVGLVAVPDNPLPLVNAVPMIMGANIGTTVTATLVSLAHMGRKEEFQRAFPVAICHDVFNYLSVLVLLPIEVATGFLRRTATFIATSLEGVGGFSYESPLRSLLETGFVPIRGLVEALSSTQNGQAALFMILAAFCIFFSLFFLVRTMRSLVHARVEASVSKALGSSAILSMTVGMVATVMVQSSSITTSLLVPLGGAGILKLRDAFPIAIGANIGTTITALFAALAVSGPNATAGLEIAVVHLLFNICGTVIIYPVEAIRRVPLAITQGLARVAVRSRKKTVVAVAAIFYGLPALILFLARVL